MSDPVIYGLLFLTALSLAVAVYAMTKTKRSGTSEAGELLGRLSQMAETQAAQQARLAEQMQTQERLITKALDEKLSDVTRRVGESLTQTVDKTTTSISELKERLAVIDAAQKNITGLSEQMVGLQNILSNKQSRGAFGEVQLENLVQSILPPSAYQFQAGVGSSGARVDCLLMLPNPPGAIAVDAKFPLESYRALMAANDDVSKKQSTAAFRAAILKHVSDISEKYIISGETADSAIMFLPSEAVYAELHANHADVVDKSYRNRVWIVSPTTLMATLNTVRAILKDAKMREQAHVVQLEVEKMLEDVGRLGDRVDNLKTHFRQASNDIKEIDISKDKISDRGAKIVSLELAESEPSGLQAPQPSKIKNTA